MSATRCCCIGTLRPVLIDVLNSDATDRVIKFDWTVDVTDPECPSHPTDG